MADAILAPKVQYDALLTPAEVRARLSYDPRTGILRWRNGRGRAGRNGIAGNVYNGYRRVDMTLGTEKRTSLYAHRLIWAIQTGEWPIAYIDHIDGDKLNNRWANLREATSSQNCCNSPDLPNKTGYRGVHARPDGRFAAQIMVRRQVHWLGYFETAEAASRAYQAARKRLHGEYRRQQPKRNVQ